MKFKTDNVKTPDLTKVVSKDSTRCPALTCAHLDTERAVIEATDSYKLVSLPVEIEDGDVSGMIPPEALAAFTKAHKAAKRDSDNPSLRCRADEIELTANGSAQTWPRGDEGQFPNIPALIPNEDSRSGFKVRLNAKLLSDLAKGLGAGRTGHEDVTLTFVRTQDEAGEDTGYFLSNLRPIIVTGSNDATGLLMPIKLP